jgi:hypothetical protein
MDTTDDTPRVLFLQSGAPPSHPAVKTLGVARVEEFLAVLRRDGNVAAVVFPPEATSVDSVPLGDVVRALRPDVATVDAPGRAQDITAALHRHQVRQATTWVTRGCLTVLPRAVTLARLRDVLHDANNPLGAVLGNLASIGQVSSDAGVQDAVADGLEALALVRQVFEHARADAAPLPPSRRGRLVTVAALVDAVTGMLATTVRARCASEGNLSVEEVAFWGPLLLLLLHEEAATLEIHRAAAHWRMEVHHRRHEPEPAAAELVECLGGTLEGVTAPDGEPAWRVVLPARD